MVVDEQEFRAFLANVQTLLICKTDSDVYARAFVYTKGQIKKYKEQIDNQPIKSKWKQLQLPINP